MNIRVAAAEEVARLADRYAEWGYGGGIAPGDVVLVAEEGGEPIGIVRQTIEEGVVMLRGMYVAPNVRQQGTGSALLRAFVTRLEREPVLRGRACYGVPYAHLEQFYARGGFVFVPTASAPVFLQARMRSYEQDGLHMAIMRREPSSGTKASPPG